MSASTTHKGACVGSDSQRTVLRRALFLTTKKQRHQLAMAFCSWEIWPSLQPRPRGPLPLWASAAKGHFMH